MALRKLLLVNVHVAIARDIAYHRRCMSFLPRSLLALALLFTACDRGTPSPTRDPSPASAEASAWIKLSPGSTPLEAQLAAESAKAKARSLMPVLYIGASWCNPCKALKASRSDPRMVEAFHGTYIVEVDADDWKGDIKALGFNDGTIPAFFPIDDRGHPSGPSITGGAWAEDVPANMAPVLKKFFHR